MGNLFLCLVWISAALAIPVKDIGEKEENILEKRGDANNENVSNLESSQINLPNIIEKIVGNEARRLLDASRHILTNLTNEKDKISKSSISHYLTHTKEVEVLDNEVAESSEPDQPSITLTFPKRGYESKDKPCYSLNTQTQTKPSFETLFRSFTPSFVTVHTALYSSPDGPIHSLEVPLVPDMDVWKALVFAAKNFKEAHEDVSDAMNPFNAALRWEDKMECYVIVKLLGQENDVHEYWEVALLSTDHEIKYQDRCMPYEEKLVLRPRDQLVLFYM